MTLTIVAPVEPKTKTFRPYTIGEHERGVDAYLLNLWPYEKSARRLWKYRRQTRTVQAATGEYLKSSHAFKEETPDQLEAIVEESREHGVGMPAGYADVFRKRFFSPTVPWSYNGALVRHFRAGWQQAIATGIHDGVHFKYDIRSAYLWAVTFGLPDPATYRFTRSLASGEGVYRVQLERPVPWAAYPYNSLTDVLATPDEIALYDLPVERVVCGVTWERMLPRESIEKIIASVRAVSFWKKAARSYWGAWAQVAPVECWTPKSSWKLPPLGTNIPWAHLIVGRVREKVFHALDSTAVHVFVDSIITKNIIKTGEGLGDWKIEKVYEGGVVVRAAGWYGEINKPLDKAAGLPQALRTA